ncbi:hypothetical protein THAOC_18764 [Thalassiosira oceanica]|uniref:Uncharacterized protein n=1 Tax=Thalassiosira oceanica TaxID=159749 RepID=K0SIH6_THAOC|nr:hypothetical protein THAOC_18764 [Thalassiosira oceanica]|eukprot:EJK60821.1 hypothetical protein THAOC_18764 [Thalassiosira oceanica]
MKGVAQRRSGERVLKEDEQRFQDPIQLFPLGSIFYVGGLLVTKQHPVGLGRLGRHNDDRESRAPPWPPLKPAATEVRCGIELSPFSAACPSGTIYTSFWPDICAGILSGTSAAPLSVGLDSRPSSDLQIKRRCCRDDFVYKSTFDVANRRTMETRC